MKAVRIFIIISFLFLFESCGLMSSIKDLTSSADLLIKNINDVMLQIDSQVETGALEQSVATLIDERLANLAQLIETSIQNNGGFLFDQVNGSVDNVFMNVSSLLDQIKKGILDESLPMLIDQLSMQLQNNINLLSSNIQDIVVLTFGNTFILVDKTVNSVVIISCIIFLAIGLFVFAIILIGKRDRKFNFGRIVGLIFMVLYVGFFLTMVLSTKLRGNIIAGFDFGKKYEGVTVSPKITSVYPESFVLGKNNKLYLYGTHLNKIDTLSIALQTGNTVNFKFPESCIIVKSENRIVLGNFDSKLQWTLPKFVDFRNEIAIADKSILISPNYLKMSNEVNKSLYSNFQPVAAQLPSVEVARSRISNISRSAIISAREIQLNSSVAIFGAEEGNKLNMALRNFFLQRFKLPVGDYGITAYNGKTIVQSPQLISISNPPPPIPDPDIYILGLTWNGGTNPVAGISTSINVQLGFGHPEQLTREFKIKLTSAPPITPIDITVPMSAVASAQTNNNVTVTSRTFTPTNPGNYNFTAVADYDNAVKESNEGNNTYSGNLGVNSYIYDVTVNYYEFISTDDNESGDDEYRIKILTDVTGHSQWENNFAFDGNPGSYGISYTNTYTNLLPGSLLHFGTSGYEEDGGARDGDDDLGNFNTNEYLSSNPTNGNDSAEFAISLNTGYYKIIGKYTVVRRIVP